MTPDLRNLASKYPNRRGYLLKRDWDFGTVNVALLKRRVYAKHLNYSFESFGAATAPFIAFLTGRCSEPEPAGCSPEQSKLTGGWLRSLTLVLEVMNDWPFDQGKNVAAITTRQVLREGHPILRVIHYSD